MLLTLWALLSLLLAPAWSKPALITLYSPSDNVTELTDANITAVFNADRLWVVQFYAHWCGHCQRFVPTWVEVANSFAGWSDYISIAALNCAQNEACADFAVKGTPTLRYFHPRTPPGQLGQEISERTHDGIAGTVLAALEGLALTGMLKPGFPIMEKHSSISPFDANDWMAFLDAVGPKKGVLITEPPQQEFLGGSSKLTLGQKVQIELGKSEHRDQILGSTVFRFQDTPRDDANAMAPVTRPKVFYLDGTGSPAQLITLHGGQPFEQQLVQFLANEEEPTGVAEVEGGVELGVELVGEIGAGDGVVVGAEDGGQVVEEVGPEDGGQVVEEFGGELIEEDVSTEVQKGPDEVHAGDLEKQIQYVMFNEVPAHPVLDADKLSALYLYLEAVAKYSPVRQEIKDFVTSLREWPIRMGLKAVSAQDFREKVEELDRLYKPFEATPKSWQACNGSQPHLRGYPCSTWVHFHTMMANAAIQGDPAMTFRGPSTVARAMVAYIHHFFSCRHCAENFAMKVHTLGFLPTTPKDSVLWLWQIHNMANKLLKGDPTEDPAHPKVTWPTEANCPNCRGGTVDFHDSPGITTVEGHLWKIENLVKYLINVYRKENVIPNENNVGKRRREGKVLELESMMTEAMSKLEEEPDTGVSLNLNNLIVINEYCKSLIKGVDKDR